MTTTVILFSIFLLCILGCLGLVVWLYRLNTQSRIKSRIKKITDSKIEIDHLSSQDGSAKAALSSTNLEDLRVRISGGLAFLSSNDLRKKIASAYWPISDTEFSLVRIGASLVGLLLGWLISRNILGGLGLGFVFFLLPGIFLERAIIKRRKKFQNQLIDYLVLIKGAISAGNSLVQALDLANKEMPAPISEEFSQVLREMNLGILLEEAMNNLTERMQGDDLKIIATAIIINSQLGGNLSTILEATIDTIRERVRLFSEVRTLTAYPRYAALILTLLPFFVALLIFLIRPAFFDPVRTSTLSQMILGAALLGILIGNFFLRRLLRTRI
jgi:tight adherence protein B